MESSFFDFGEIVEENPFSTKANACDVCSKRLKINTPIMKFAGKGERKILIINGAPSKKSDREGKPFQDKAGKLLKETLMELGLSLTRDTIYGYAVSCHIPLKNKKSNVNDADIRRCHNILTAKINEFKPHVIITLGIAAAASVIRTRAAGRLTGIKMTAYYGEQIPDQDWKVFICPTWSPEEVRKSVDFKNVIDPVVMKQWKRDLRKAINLLITPFYTHNYSNDVIALHKLKESLNMLDTIYKTWTHVTFDYETTGIKPHREGHYIDCVGFSNGIIGVGMPYFDDPEFHKKMKLILRNTKIKKIAHNAKFEDTWSHIRGIKQHVRNMYWCTMIGAHCLHNKKNVGAKYLIFCKLGILNYDSEVDKYLKPTEEEELKYGRNAINQIHLADTHQKLLYVARDAHLEYKLFEYQDSRLKGKLREGFLFLHKGTMAHGIMEAAGFKLNMEEAELNTGFVKAKMDGLWDRILELPESKGWDRKIQGKGFQHHIYDMLRFEEPVGMSDDLKPGNRPENEEALLSLKSSFTDTIVKIRKQKKIYDTLNKYTTEACDGMIHPIFSTHNVQTFRSGCSNPNIQNPFKRNKKARTMLRSALRPSPGNEIWEWDYKMLEVVIAGCVFKDPEWLAYCFDQEHADMHKDVSFEMLFLDDEIYNKWMGITDPLTGGKVAKNVRQASKNGYVFPSVYGAGVEKTASGVWKQLPEITKKHLSKIGMPTYFGGPQKGSPISSYGRFKEWMKLYIDYYWNEKYPTYKDNRDIMHKKYLRDGYVDMVTGFRYWGPMSFNNFCNGPVQGPASHIKLWTMEKTQKEAKRLGLKSKQIYEIHDSIGWDGVPEEREIVDELMFKYGTLLVREHWDWIISPLTLEKEVSGIDGTWNDMKEIEEKEWVKDEWRNL